MAAEPLRLVVNAGNPEDRSIAADLDDVRALALPALRHRLVLGYRAEADGVKDAEVVGAILKAARA